VTGRGVDGAAIPCSHAANSAATHECCATSSARVLREGPFVNPLALLRHVLTVEEHLRDD
jgi:hypothetical protein